MAAPKRKSRRQAAARLDTRANLAIGSESAGDYRQLYDFAPVIWMVLDMAGMIRDINGTGAAMLGSNPRFVIGTPLRMWVEPEYRDPVLEHLRRCRTMDDVMESELKLTARLERQRTLIRLHSRRARLDNQIVFPTVGIDISENELLDRARLAAERQRDLAEMERRSAREAEAVKDRLIATVSHELRNPLSPALFAASMLCDWPELPERARSMAAVIKRNVELEARLIDDLLDFARVSRGQLELRMKTIDVHEILQHAIEVCASTAAAKNIAIDTEFRAAGRHSRGDASRIEQVFWNLLNNAIKFSPRNGQIAVRTSSDSAGAIKILVRDFGAGMDEETLERLFTPFAQPRAPAGQQAGLGLGLTIARGIVELHGGTIWAGSSGPGLGSMFEVELATTPAPQSVEGQALPNAACVPSAGLRVLLVENHEDTGATLVAGLSQRGYQVTHVRTLKEGLALADSSWDVILSDIGLDDGSGLEMARHLRAGRGKTARLIAVSGYGAENDIAASREAGFDEHIVKPIDVDRLVELIEAAPAAAQAVPLP